MPKPRGHGERVFNLDWTPDNEDPQKFVSLYGKPPGEENKDFSGVTKLTQQQIGATLKRDWNVRPPTDCAGCHR